MPRPNTIAICSARQAIALAACAHRLPMLSEGATEALIQLTPAGEFTPADGRKMEVPAWRIDAASAVRVIAAYARRKNLAVLDYEHQTFHKEANGQPAPAAGWLRELRWEDGKGLFAYVELTARARWQIRRGEYRYVSPVFRYDLHSGEILAIEMAALTNNPAIDGMEPLALRAAATFGITTTETPAMSKLLAALIGITLLGLKPEATEDEASAACNSKLNELAQLRNTLSVPASADAATALATCTALRTRADAGVDPALFVPVATVEAIKSQLAVLSAKSIDREVGELVESGLADGRLLPAQKEWATSLGKANVTALTAYLTATPPIAALTGSQSGGKSAAVAGTAPALTAEELAVCDKTGISPENYRLAKA